MRRWQIVTLAVLFLLPVVIYVGWSGYAVWQLGGWGYIAWLVPLAWTLAWWLARRWQPRASDHGAEPAPHWTARDEAAWEIVTRRASEAPRIATESLLDPHFYLSTSQRLALDIARHYHPHAEDPLGPLTVPEVMAAAELALRDTSQWVRDYVPGSHLLRIDHWRMVAEAPRWARLAGNAWWIGSVLLNPADLVRKLLTRLSVDSASREVQAGLLAGFYSVFVQRAGFYLIEVHSGRLRRGADHYLEAQRRFGPSSKQATVERPGSEANGQRSAAGSAVDSAAGGPTPFSDAECAGDERSPVNSAPSGPEERDAPDAVTLVVAGQVKAGKSSLINALLGQARADVDLLPCTRQVRRYRWQRPGLASGLQLLDTPGYGDDGLTDDQLDEIQLAIENADALLLVMNATSPARAADLELLAQLERRLEKRPERKTPPVIGVLTHIDGLRPVLEWSPPYDWQNPQRPKERSIRDAIDYQREQFGDRLAAIAPVCTDVARQRVYGLEEWLLPIIVSRLSQARACAFLRYLHDDWNEHKIAHLWQQLRNVGRSLWQWRGSNGDRSSGDRSSGNQGQR